MIKCGPLKGCKQILTFQHKIAHSVHFPLKLFLIIYLFTIFFFLIHGNVFLSIFAYLVVSILYKISNYHLHIYTEIYVILVFLCRCAKNLKNLMLYIYGNSYVTTWGGGVRVFNWSITVYLILSQSGKKTS